MKNTTHPSEVSLPSPVITIVNNHVTTTSLEVARVFEKRHDRVMRAIKALDLPEDFNRPNFGEVEYQDAKGEKRPMYHITRDGFTILAMGFTGAKAMKFKLAYIEAFNRMEAELTRQSAGTIPAMSGASQTKICSKCRQHVPLTHFWKNITSNDGLQSCCSNCMRALKARYSNRNRERNMGIAMAKPEQRYLDLTPVIEPGDKPTPPSPQEWQETWGKLNESFSMIRVAVDQLHAEVTTRAKTYHSLTQQYADLRKAAQQIQFLESMLMWTSPAATAFNLSLDKPMK